MARAQEPCGRRGLLVPNKPNGFCGRKATLNSNSSKLSELRSCEAVLGSPSLISLMVSVDVNQHWTRTLWNCQSSGAVLKVEVAVVGSPSLISLVVSVDVKQHWIKSKRRRFWGSVNLIYSYSQIFIVTGYSYSHIFIVTDLHTARLFHTGFTCKWYSSSTKTKQF